MTTNNDKDFDLEWTILALLKNEPFYANFSCLIDKVPSTTIPTAGVKFNQKNLSFEFYYNKEFMKSFPENVQRGIVIHEFDHIILNHCTSRIHKDHNQKKVNICADFAINSLPGRKENLPDIAMFPEKYKLPPMKSLEWYLYNFPKELEDMISDSGKGNGFDDHSMWGESQEGETEDDRAAREAMAKAKLQEVIEKAVQKTIKQQSEKGSTSWGSVSVEMQEKMLERLKTKSIDPKKIFSYFVKTSISIGKKRRITKINKRKPYIRPGKSRTTTANVAISVDQSGSVSDQLLEKVFGWMGELSKFVTFTFVPFDTSVPEDGVFVWQKDKKIKAHRVMCGGTDFDAPTRWVNERNFDGHIIVTDMLAPKPINSKCQRMWLTDESGLKNKPFDTNEKILVIK